MSHICVQNLSFSYKRQLILDQVQLELRPNCFSVLLGRNGSGKSTLFNLLAGIYPLQSGEILFDGAQLETLKGVARAKQLGFLAQSHRSSFNFKVIDVVMTGRAAFSGYSLSQQDQAMAMQALDTLDICHLKDRDYTSLSGGEKQLVMIARILTQNPKVILLDEPTNHLDVYYQAYLMQKLKALTQQNYTVVAIMHDPNLAFLYADEFYFVRDRKVIRPELPAQATDPEFLADIYGLAFEQGWINQHKIVMPKKPED